MRLTKGQTGRSRKQDDYFWNSSAESDAEDVRFKLNYTPRLPRRRSSRSRSIGVAPRPRKSGSTSWPHQSYEDPELIDVSRYKWRRPRAPHQAEDKPFVGMPRRKREGEPYSIGDGSASSMDFKLSIPPPPNLLDHPRRKEVAKVLARRAMEESAAAVAPSPTDAASQFLGTGRTGRRNALPDILGQNARVSSSDLPERMQSLCSVQMETSQTSSKSRNESEGPTTGGSTAAPSSCSNAHAPPSETSS